MRLDDHEEELTEELGGEVEVGECGYCHELKEIVAEMEMTAANPRTGAVLGKTDPIDLCEEFFHD